MPASQLTDAPRSASTRFADLTAGLRAWVRDSPAHERAAVDLLIWDESWLHRADFTGACITQAAPGLVARIDWGEARRFVDRGFARLGQRPVPSMQVNRRVLAAAVAIGLNLYGFPGMSFEHRDAITQAFATALGISVRDTAVRTARVSQALTGANAERTAAAGRRDAGLAARALEVLGDGCCPAWKMVARARIEHPGMSWREVAATLGLTKDQAAGDFRRMLDAARKKGL